MKTMVDLRTVDLTAYPDLVVIYLGMRVRTFAGIKTLLGLGPQIDKAGTQRPEGLLHLDAVGAPRQMVVGFSTSFRRHRFLA
jgi:hypothetical protein